MKVLLAHARQRIPWNGPWIYLGTDYRRMKEWQHRVSGPRQSLTDDLVRAAERLRPAFLDWIERQRVANDDSLAWWMTHLAGRNNLVSPLFASMCQLAALDAWLTAHGGDAMELFVVCEDGFLLGAVRANIASRIATRRSPGSWIAYLGDVSRHVLRVAKGFLGEIRRCWALRRAARRTRQGQPAAPDGEVFVVHQCLDDSAFKGTDAVTCRYFTVLPRWLEQRGHRVVRLPWFANVTLPLDDAMRRVRASGSVVIEDWLNPGDYFHAIRQEIRAAMALMAEVPFPGMDLRALRALRARERLLQLGAGSAHFWLHRVALPRWGAKLDRCVMVTHFEGMIPEHVPIFLARNVLRSSIAIGYMHSLASRDFLAYHFDRGEWSSRTMPDVVVTSGELGKDMLVRNGAQPERVVVGPALRQVSHPRAASAAAREDLVVLLPLMYDMCVELLDSLAQHREWIGANLRGPVWLKTHPMARTDRLLAALGWEALPGGWQFTDAGAALTDVLAGARCCVTMATASAFDAVLGGAIVLPIAHELDVAWNNLDLLEEDFPMVRAARSDEIRERLRGIFVTERDAYDRQFAALRVRVSDGLGAIDDRSLEAFVR